MDEKLQHPEHEEWYEIASNDLNSAMFLTKMHPPPVEIICYHCQQAAEKYMKGFLVLKQTEIIFTHDLMVLYKKCLALNTSFAEIEDECIRLTDYAITTRYPYPLEVNEDDMKLALTDVEKIKEFVLKMCR